MALVTTLVRVPLKSQSGHSVVDCTYDIHTDDQGRRFLQLDTYGSSKRKIKGKKSQSIRFDMSGIEQLKRIIAENDL